MTDNDCLYHYCSPHTALSILENRSFWLTPASESNDKLEGKIVSDRIREELIKNSVSVEIADLAKAFVLCFQKSAEGFTFCMSEQGDLLSQWRAYANDGTGFSLGFKKSELCRVHPGKQFGANFFEIKKITYDDHLLREHIKDACERVINLFNKHGDFARLSVGVTVEEAVHRYGTYSKEGFVKVSNQNAFENFNEAIKSIGFSSYGYKPISFSEENEWRAIRPLHPAPHSEIKFRSLENRISPYIPCEIPNPETLKYVVIGPKNNTDFGWLKSMLSKFGFENTTIIASTASSYR